MERKTAADFDPELLRLFDRYVHGGISRRAFLDGAARFAVGGLTATAILESLSPNYAEAQQVPANDPRIQTKDLTYPCPARGCPGQAAGVRRRPREPRPHNPYIADVTRRLGVAGLLALAPDGLTPVGGYPGNDDKGRELQAGLDSKKLLEDFVTAVGFLRFHSACTGKVGVIGFCYGGGVANALAVRLPELAAAAPFYGMPPALAEVPKIKAPLLLHYAATDERINAGWPAYEAALQANKVPHTAHIYPETNHGFHNDTTPRYDQAAATLAWERTLAFLTRTLK